MYRILFFETLPKANINDRIKPMGSDINNKRRVLENDSRQAKADTEKEDVSAIFTELIYLEFLLTLKVIFSNFALTYSSFSLGYLISIIIDLE